MTIRRTGACVVVFLAAAFGLSLAWSLASPMYARALAEPSAALLYAISPDIVWKDRSNAGTPVLVLENNHRQGLMAAAESVSGFGVPVFLALIATAFTCSPRRRALGAASAATRTLAGIAAVMLSHGIGTIVLVGYVSTSLNRGSAPAALRLAGSLADVVQVFVPFLIFATAFRPVLPPVPVARAKHDP